MIPFDAPRFGQPPSRRTKWRTIADRLAQQPGEWAAVGTLAANQGLDRARLASYGIEARRHGAVIWARYVGPEQACQPGTAEPLPASASPLVSTRRRNRRWSWGQVVAA